MIELGTVRLSKDSCDAREEAFSERQGNFELDPHAQSVPIADVLGACGRKAQVIGCEVTRTGRAA